MRSSVMRGSSRRAICRERCAVALLETIDERLAGQVVVFLINALRTAKRRLSVTRGLCHQLANHRERRGQAEKCEKKQHVLITP